MTNDGATPVRRDDEIVFSYGTLRSPQVQRALLGRTLRGHDDLLLGHRLDWVIITDPQVIAISGSGRHPVLRRGDASDTVPGTALGVTSEELDVIDRYEVDYVRDRVTLESGARAWAYVSRPAVS